MTRLNCCAQCHVVLPKLWRLGRWDGGDMYDDEGGGGGGPKVCSKNCADILRQRVNPVIIDTVIHHLSTNLLVTGLLIPTRFVR